MMLYSNSKVKVRSPDRDSDFFDIVVGALQEDTIAPYLFIICLDYVLQTSIDIIKENGFTLKKKKKARSRRYSAETVMDAADADDTAFLANTPTQTKSLLNSLDQTAAGSDHHLNSDKTKYMFLIKKKTSSL